MDCVGAEEMYQLLEGGVGQYVKSLIIGDMYQVRKKEIVYDRSGIIILERILAACPNLQQFEYLTSRAVVFDDRYYLPPAAFKNYRQ